VPRHTKRITTTILRKFFFVFHLEELQVIEGPKDFEADAIIGAAGKTSWVCKS